MTTSDKPIGSKVYVDGIPYIISKPIYGHRDNHCGECDLRNGKCIENSIKKVSCSANVRTDGEDVIYKIDKSDKEEIKKFLLEEQYRKYDIDVKTKSGYNVRILCSNAMDDPDYPVIALVKFEENESLERYNIYGEYKESNSKDENDDERLYGYMDLVLRTRQKCKWINIYGKLGIEITDGILYETKEDAMACASKDNPVFSYIGAAKLTYDKGDY